MLNDYADIIERIPEPPLWWDEFGVPRYCAFDPDKVGNVYAREAVLFEIACQSCGRRFHVVRSSGKAPAIADAIASHELHYGDPPNVGCCAAGHTMNSVPLQVMEYWRRDQTTGFAWERDRALEVAINVEDD